MDRLLFEKLISRDWSLMFCEDLHTVNTKEMKKQFDWNYSEMVFEGKEGVVNIYCSPEEQTQGLTNIFIKKVEQNKDWVFERNQKIKEQVKSIREILNKFKVKQIDEFSNKELLGLLELLSKMNIESHAYYAIMVWVPINMEKEGIITKYRLFVDEIIKTRAEIQDVKPLIDYAYLTTASLILKKANLQPNLAKYVSFKDVFNYLNENKMIDEDVIMARKNYYILTNEGILLESINDYLNSHDYEIIIETKTGESQIVKGGPASPGEATGYARIVLNREMFGKVEYGDIIIAHMTTPDFIEVIKKASAIITDEGGITCHAAIICLEFNMPCIVGTKNATKVFKDGDWVYVNATKGFAEKIRSPAPS